MHQFAERQVLELRLTEARRERDAWDGRSRPAYEAAAKLIAALEKRIQQLDELSDEADFQRTDQSGLT